MNFGSLIVVRLLVALQTMRYFFRCEGREVIMSLLFISYRRDDVGAFTHELGDALSRSLGESKVFLDLDRIRIGSHWQQRITDALARATLLILVIGPRWLHLQDIHGRRRLDNPDDWVRMEIQLAIRRGISILPILVDGTSVPMVEALPQELQPLTGYQAYSFSTQYFKRDFPDFLRRLGDFGFRSHIAADVLPAALDRSLPLTEVDLREALKALPNWELVDSRPLPEGTGAKIELFRHYIFSSFGDAMHFMSVASAMWTKRIITQSG